MDLDLLLFKCYYFNTLDIVWCLDLHVRVTNIIALGYNRLIFSEQI
jgi:hypothetical protein